MTKKEILKQWCDEPRKKYGSCSRFVAGYADGWEWVKDTLGSTLTKNATFSSSLDSAFAVVDTFLKKKNGNKKPEPKDCTVYAVGYKDGVKDSVVAIRKRLEQAK